MHGKRVDRVATSMSSGIALTLISRFRARLAFGSVERDPEAGELFDAASIGEDP